LIIPVTPGRQVDKLTFSNRVTRYKVRKRDTVLSIADDFGVPAERLRKWNHLKGNNVKAGRVLRIYRPTGETEEQASAHRDVHGRGKKATVASSRKGTSGGEDEPPEIAGKSKHGSSLQPVSSKVVRHKVKPGETLTSIANSYNTTVAQLKKDNKLEADNLKAGQVLVVK
jgi:membrane-bound lytic murein transglycosylase D